MPQNKPNLLDLHHSELESLLESVGQPRYRADQIWQWLYKQLATEIQDMTSLPKALRAKLEEVAVLHTPKVLATQESLTGETRKDLLAMRDGEQVEVILMRYIERRTVCVSTQVGCAIGCQFCATGQMGFQRHLSSGEIVAQVLHFERTLRAQGRRVTNIVFMGMGEPLLNYDNTLAAITRLMDPAGLQMGQRRMTLSTVGISTAIRRFAKEKLQVNLAVSLHAATDELRSELMPVDQRHDLDALFAAVQEYINRTNRQVTFEWALIDGVNDTPEQAAALAARIAGMLVHVNLIPLNPTDGYPGQPSSEEHMAAFTDILDRRHIPYTMRLRRGGDIQAGCGQLRARIHRQSP
jgi:23S rRNA (adenine2503-C2)-methyltransferase